MSDGDAADGSTPDAESVFAGWALRVEEGEALDFDELLRAHPQLEGGLRRLHEDWKLFAPILGKAVPGLVVDESGVVSPPLSGGPEGEDAPPSDALYARLGIDGSNEGRYRFRSVIGRGGGGVVLKVWDAKLNRPLAMKVVLGRDEQRPSGQTPRVDSRTLSRFVDEARIASQLNHPGIVPVHELGKDETGRAFFTMKLVKGLDLACIFEKVRTGEDGWNATRALTVLQRVCEAMAYAHDKGVIHRDLKPANIMVGAYGEVYVMDWGLARALGQADPRDLRIRPTVNGPVSVVQSFRKGDRDTEPDSSLVTMDGSVLGTPSYMAPEQARGKIEEVGTRADVYSVGAMLYHLIGGEPPYVPRGQKLPAQVVLTNVLHGEPRRLEQFVPRAIPELVAICEMAMQREANRRFESMRELAADLRAYLEGRVVAAYETGTWAETKKWVRRNRALALTLVALVLIATAGGTLLAMESRKATQRANELAREKARTEALAASAANNGYSAAITGAQLALSAGEPATLQRLLQSAPTELRQWEWRYLNAMSDWSLLTLDIRASGTEVRFSEDGTRLVTASKNGNAYVWDASSGKLQHELEGSSAGWWLCRISPTGNTVVTATPDKSCQVWNVSTGNRYAALSRKAGPLERLCFSADGTQLATTSGDQALSLWATSSGELITRLEKPNGQVLCLGRSTEGARVVTASSDQTALVWDVSANRVLAELTSQRNRGAFRSQLVWATFSLDAKYLLAAWASGEASIWETETETLVASLIGVGDGGRFSNDGSRVVIYHGDTARVWTAPGDEPTVSLKGHTGDILDASFSADGMQIVTASADDTARLWKASGGESTMILRGHTSDVTGASFDPDGTRIATVASDGTAKVWDVSRLLDPMKLGRGKSMHASFSRDGTRIVTISALGSAQILDPVEGRSLFDLDSPAPLSPTSTAAFSPDGGRVVITVINTAARVWDVDTGQVVIELAVPSMSVLDAVFSPDGARVAAAVKRHILSPDDFAESMKDPGGVRVWNAETGEELLSLSSEQRWLEKPAFSPDGFLIATPCSDKTVIVWNAFTGECVARLTGHTGYVYGATFSPDGARIITNSGDGTAKLWAALGGELIASLEGHSDVVWCANFSGDGTRAVTASWDGTARVWDASSGVLLATLEGHADKVDMACFSPDGSRVMTQSWDDTVRVWNPSTGLQLLKLDGKSFATFSPDGTRILTDGNGSEVIWDSVSYRERHAELRKLRAASIGAANAVNRALASSHDWRSAAGALRADGSLDKFEKNAARSLFSERCKQANTKAGELDGKQNERVWIALMVGLSKWPDEASVEREYELTTSVPRDASGLNNLAWSLVDPTSPPRDVILAYVLSRRAVTQLANESGASTQAAAYRDTLARTLFCIGRFDEALAEQRIACAEAPDDESLRKNLDSLESDIASWRDESGQLRRAEWIARLEELDRSIAVLQSDADVMFCRGKKP